ncbi:MAG: 50S ribosomal protein L9 [Myxococcota bacterium]|nr:50S ribosomal protein L9 [Myxococcota bacterium]MEE2779845.1 50S ribosomal protein L9 [Myxococcota bacterium]
MHIILTQDVPSLGFAGEVVEVKAGYGANYLIPQGMALLATPSNRAGIEHQRHAIEARIVRERSEAEKLAGRLVNTSVSLTKKLVGDGDKIFGSVGSKEIAEALGDQGIRVDRRQVNLEAPLKALGVYDVELKLHRDISATIKVWVVAD